MPRLSDGALFLQERARKLKIVALTHCSMAVIVGVPTSVTTIPGVLRDQRMPSGSFWAFSRPRDHQHAFSTGLDPNASWRAHDAVKARLASNNKNLARHDKPAASFIATNARSGATGATPPAHKREGRPPPWLKHNRCRALRTMNDVSSPRSAVSDVTARLAFSCSSASSAKARTRTLS